jgi:hypothetical protein
LAVGKERRRRRRRRRRNNDQPVKTLKILNFENFYK